MHNDLKGGGGMEVGRIFNNYSWSPCVFSYSWSVLNNLVKLLGNANPCFL